MDKAEVVLIHWYNQGIAISELIDKNSLQNKKQELSKQAITYWTTSDFPQSNQ